MNTFAPLRNPTHPPDTQDREVLEVTLPSDRAELRLTDRLSLRVGLWLLVRAQRPQRRPVRRASEQMPRHVLHARDRRQVTEHEAMTMLIFDLQRHLR